MADLGFADWLTLAQTAGIVLSLLLTLYFAKRQIEAMKADVETRVLNDLDEKRYRLTEIFLGNPEFMRIVATPESGSEPRHAVAYMVALVSAHAFNVHERGLLSENEWRGWLQWIRNDFTGGSLRKDWTELNLGQWFDPRFREFIDRQVLTSGRDPAGGSPPPG